MGLGFLAPLFLAALAGVAIPVLIHLTRRPRERTIPFPSLAFLRRIPFRSVRRRRIRHWWLLALRAAAVMVLAAAFARPFLTSSAGAAPAAASRETVILLDRSMSMSYGDRWDRALGAAREAVRALTPDDRGTVVAFSETALVLAGPTSDQAVLLGALDGVRPGHGTTRLGTALGLADEILAEATGQPHVVLISDLQRGAMDDADDAALPPGATLAIVNVGGDVPQNIAVHDVAVDRVLDADRERLSVSVRVANTGVEAAEGVRVRVDLNGAEVQSRTTALPARGATSLRFDGIPAPGSAARLAVRAGDDPLGADNVRYTALQPASTVRVVVAADDQPRALYLRRALELGAEPRFTLRTVRTGALSARDLEDARAVVLLDGPPAGAGARAALDAFVRGGGGILVAAGRAGGTAPVRLGGAALSAVGGPLVDRIGDSGGRLGALDYDHPVFSLFRAPRSGDLSAARFFRYRRADAGEGTAVLARFDDGTPALLEAARAGGRVLWWTSSLDDVWSDFPLQPVFLPFVHRVVRYLAAHEPPRLAAVIGEVLDPNQLPAVRGAAQFVVESPSGQRTPLRGQGGQSGLPFTEPGYYTVRAVGAGGGGAAAELVAVNPAPEESDLTALDPGDVERRLVPTALAGGGGRALAALSPGERERRQRLWWYLLIGVLAALIVESVLANRLPVSTEVIR